MPRGRSRRGDTIVGRLKPADPFELIRWLARSQSDPRKALAELVQNSLDAGARKIRITRMRERGVAALGILDDGEGVIPELARVEALTYIATHIGYSRKRNLTPEERRDLMTQGKYGIGLLGFWAIGHELEMRSQTPEEPGRVLRLFEDQPRFEIDRMRGRLAFGDRYTEVVVRGLHRVALFSLTARRIADYLAVELRGQILAREVEIVIHDRITRGRAQKVVQVRPTRFEGRRLELPEELPVAGFTAIRVELYLMHEGPSEPGRVTISCAGTVVYESAAEFEAADFSRPPWTNPRLTGLLEFADFEVPPGSRRGVVPNRAAEAFADALRELEADVRAALEAIEAEAAAAVDQSLFRQLERAFRELPRLAPEYDFFAVRSGAARLPEAASAGDGGAADADAGSSPAPPGAAVTAEADSEAEAPSLLPAGALATLEIVPPATRVERLGERRLHATPRDPNGVAIRRDLEIAWRLEPPLGVLSAPAGRHVRFAAGDQAGVVTVFAAASEDGASAAAQATVEIVESLPTASPPASGIPEPVLVDEPASGWRSRFVDGRWEVNSGHGDYRQAAQAPRRKLRYLATLLVKEIVIHSFPVPNLAPSLERMVEVLAIVERRLERG